MSVIITQLVSIKTNPNLIDQPLFTNYSAQNGSSHLISRHAGSNRKVQADSHHREVDTFAVLHRMEDTDMDMDWQGSIHCSDRLLDANQMEETVELETED